jgi:hypothetical protein
MENHVLYFVKGIRTYLAACLYFIPYHACIGSRANLNDNTSTYYMDLPFLGSRTELEVICA